MCPANEKRGYNVSHCLGAYLHWSLTSGHLTALFKKMLLIAQSPMGLVKIWLGQLNMSMGKWNHKLDKEGNYLEKEVGILLLITVVAIAPETHDLGHIYTLRGRQDGRHFTDDIFRHIFLNENVWILNEISLKIVPKDPINNISALVQIMAWRWRGNKPLSAPMGVSLLMHMSLAFSELTELWWWPRGLPSDIFDTLRPELNA